MAEAPELFKSSVVSNQVLGPQTSSTIDWTWFPVQLGIYQSFAVIQKMIGIEYLFAFRVDLCRYFRWHSTLSAGSLFLSPASHLASFQFESWTGEPSPGLIQSFMAYLGDRTKLIANPGLRPMVRSDVSALTQLVPYWK